MDANVYCGTGNPAGSPKLGARQERTGQGSGGLGRADAGSAEGCSGANDRDGWRRQRPRVHFFTVASRLPAQVPPAATALPVVVSSCRARSRSVGGGLQPHTTYHFALEASNASGEAKGPDHEFTTASSTPPGVATGAASGVGERDATISGTVNSSGLQTTYGFEIGTEAGAYGVATGLGSVGAGLTENVVLGLQNLQAGVTYHYRVLATNADGTSYGQDQSFTTLGVPALLTVPTSPPLLASPTIAFPPEGTPVYLSPPLTRAQKLARALKACKKKPKHGRAACERRARKAYGPIKRTAPTR